MSPSFALLGILANQPSYGYELKRSYDALFGKEAPLAFGQVYTTLSRLLRDKKIATKVTEQAAGPERKRYTLTPMGRQDLEQWLQLPDKLHPETKSVLFTKVVTAILLDTSPDIYLDAQRACHIERMRQLTEIRRKGSLSQSLRADYTLFHLEADLRWIDLTHMRLDTLTKEIQNAR